MENETYAANAVAVPKPATQVDEAVGTMRSTVSTYENLISSLEDRLSHVLRPQPSPGEDTAKLDGVVPLALDIHALAIRTSKCNNWFSDILDRLEV